MEMTLTQLKAAEKNHQNVVNEGYDGFNPWTKRVAKKIAEDFGAEWTLDVTIQRRREWNEFARTTLVSMGQTMEMAAAARNREDAQGWRLTDLRVAIRNHGI